MEISASRFEGILEEQESEAVRALLNWRKEKLKSDVEELRENLELLSGLLMDYIEDMTAAVRPNNENAYVLVDRNDIWFNLKQIMLEVERSEPPASGRALNAYSGRSTKVSKPHISESMTAGEISAAKRRYEKELEEKKNREENYRKLKNFCGGTASRARSQLENLYEELESIYKRNIVVYENTDDRYQSESGSVYHACSTKGQEIKDTIEMSKKFTDSIAGGVGTAIIDFIKAIFGLSCFVVKGTAAAMTAIITVPLGITPLWVKETGAEYLKAGEGIVSILKNPILLVEGIGQSMSDAVEKEGIAYGISYTLTDYVIGKKVESLLSGIKTVDKVDEVVDAVDKVGDVTDAVIESGLDAGLIQSKIEDIINTPKGNRPDPSSYLSQEYIAAHLAQFDDGASIIMTKEQYINYVKGNSTIGIPTDGTQFVLPKSYCDDIASKAANNIGYYEQSLGFDAGHFSDGGGLVRIDIENLDGLNIRIPSGNEAGANSHWIPGGKTDGGVPEAILDLIPNDPNNVTISEIK